MKRGSIVLVVTLLLGCAAEPQRTATDAVADFIVVSELQEQDTVRRARNFHYTYLTDRYVILRTRKDQYLVKFRRRCHALNEERATPDIRRDGDTLRPRFDTIRGCHIEQMFAIDEVQAEELKFIGKAPGEDTG